MTTGAPEVRIDFGGDGTFAAGDDVTADVRWNPGLAFSRGTDMRALIGKPAGGSCELELGNDPDHGNGVYSEGGAKEPTAGMRIRVRKTDPATATVWPQWTGVIQDVQHHPEISRQAVSLTCDDLYSLLSGAPAIATDLYEDETVDVLLGALADAIDWPAGDRDFDTGKTAVKQWWVDDQMRVPEELEALQNTEGPGARIYIDARGYLVFRNRHHRVLNAASTTVQQTFRGSGTEPVHSDPFGPSKGRDQAYNYARFTVTRRSTKATSVIWSAGSTITLAAGQTYAVTVRDSDRQPFKNLLVPVAGTDYTLDAGAVSSMTLERTSGAQSQLTIIAGAAGCTLSGLQVRGDLVSVDGVTTRETTIDTSASQAEFGLRTWDFGEHPVRAEIDEALAQDWVNAVPGWWGDGRPTIDPLTVFADRSAAAMTAALSLEISDRVAIYATRGSIAGDEYWVEQMAHRFEDGMQVMTLGCEKALPANQYGVWDEADWDTGLWGW